MYGVYLYGPSGSGKSTVGRLLAGQLNLPFYDLDELISDNAGMDIPQIFALEGESGFRQRESEALERVALGGATVIALGGGALLRPENRRLAEESGQVVCLSADSEILAGRLAKEAETRPLLSSTGQESEVGGDYRQRLQELLEKRSAHYASFGLKIDTSHLAPGEAAWETQVRLGRFYVTGMGAGYPVVAAPGGLAELGRRLLELGLGGPLALVSDTNVAPLHAQAVLDVLQGAGYMVKLVQIPAGEQHKNLKTLEYLWQGFLAAGIERGSTVLALGGGVVGDLAGFAAATFLRGVRWVVLPTSLLAMVDASLGGKTGMDLPQGKNLVGAFHPPALVLADPDTLATLPQSELRNGMAEVVKHGVIGDATLFEMCESGWNTVQANLVEIVRRGMAVKVHVIQIDPYEQGQRAALNLGHTLGHAIELASDFRLGHGEAVGIGMVAVARLAERRALAEAGLAQRIANALERLGLPIETPADLDRERVIAGIGVDKKRKGGKVRLAVPLRVGEVVVGVTLEEVGEILL